MKVFAENRKARNSYEFSEYIEAGNSTNWCQRLRVLEMVESQ